MVLRDEKERQRRQERLDFMNSLPCPIDQQVIREQREKSYEAYVRPIVIDNTVHVYRPKAGYLYIIQCLGFPYYKIGQSTGVWGRLKSMQTGCPFELNIEYAIQVRDRNEAETIIHEQYKPKRMRGEWFMLTDAELETVKEDMVILKDYDYSQSRPGLKASYV